jgi:hypothetical protein
MVIALADQMTMVRRLQLKDNGQNPELRQESSEEKRVEKSEKH